MKRNAPITTWFVDVGGVLHTGYQSTRAKLTAWGLPVDEI